MPKPGIARTTVQAGGQVILDPEIQRAAHLQAGDAVEVEVTGEGILLRPARIDPDQAWFWTHEWQTKEREVDEEGAAGLGELFTSGDEFLSALQERM
ncbi:MAG: AbrB/MazE/SpoVT family DNA-binding domain-containing protein [Chloroflexota bacterium]